MRFPIYFDGDITVQDVADALATRGIHLVSDNGGRMTAHHVPRFLVREADSNVVPIKRKARK